MADQAGAEGPHVGRVTLGDEGVIPAALVGPAAPGLHLLPGDALDVLGVAQLRLPFAERVRFERLNLDAAAELRAALTNRVVVVAEGYRVEGDVAGSLEGLKHPGRILHVRFDVLGRLPLAAQPAHVAPRCAG